MFDIDLPIQSKAIYAYFCSYLGSGRTIFPKRETILSDLKISKNAYYKHFKPLLDNGYIKITKAKGYKNKNIYTVCNNPKKVNCVPCSKGISTSTESLLAIDGINANGYGFIPKLIMRDSRLSIKAKALIAFFYSLVQAGFSAYPHRNTIYTFLNISKNIYYSALNQLVEYGYISIKQRHDKSGRFSVNDYILNSNPKAEIEEKIVSEAGSPCPKNEDIINNSLNSEYLPCPEICDNSKNGLNTENVPCPENKDIINFNRVLKNETLPCSEKDDNNNSTNNNTIIAISPSNLNLRHIPYCTDKERIKDMIYELTRYEDYLYDYNDQADICFTSLYKKSVQALIEMLCVEDHHIYSKQCVKTKDLFASLNGCITKDIDGYSLRDLIMETVHHYQHADSIYNIKRPFEYLKSLLWHNIKNFDL